MINFIFFIDIFVNFLSAYMDEKQFKMIDDPQVGEIKKYLALILFFSLSPNNTLRVGFLLISSQSSPST
jgi:hypothetical protein